MKLLFALCLLVVCSHPRAAAQNSSPNILFILTDDQGIGDLSLHGNDSIRTPNMDRLLQAGARFERFYVSPVCAPTRASFLSGLYHPRTGAVFVTRRRETMSDEVTTLAEHLGEAGYRTGLFGKWHNGATFPYHPGGQGFDEFLGFTLGHFNDYFSGELRDEADRRVPFHGDLTEILTDSAAHFMLQQNDAPFFCMLAYQAPHTPVQVAEHYWQEVQERGLRDERTAGIYAMVESVDDRIGELLDRLAAADKLDNTIVVFSTDNGPNGYRYRRGLKGVKGHVDEGGVRVPFGIRLPEGHPANGSVFSTPAAHIDLLPTLLDLIGRRVPEGLDGTSLRPLLEGGELPERYIYTFKQGYDYTGFPGSIRNERYLYVAPDSSTHELYDLAQDPGQRNDIYATAGGIGPRMADEYRRFATSIGRPDRIAPPVALDAAPGVTVRLLAHEGRPVAGGATRFAEGNGWANDYFVQVDTVGAQWPVTTGARRRFRVRVLYSLRGDREVPLEVATDAGSAVAAALPPARAERLPVADRIVRKEVYPYAWETAELGTLNVQPGASQLVVRTQNMPAGELWIKEVHLIPPD